jgi:hypothetical protein
MAWLQGLRYLLHLPQTSFFFSASTQHLCSHAFPAFCALSQQESAEYFFLSVAGFLSSAALTLKAIIVANASALRMYFIWCDWFLG